MLETPDTRGLKNAAMAKFGDDSNLYAEFEMVPLLDEFKSAELGRPFYNDVEIVTIFSPGNNKSTFKDKVNAVYKQRFPMAWEAYKSQNHQVHEGLSITEWPVVTKGQAMNLKAINIHTVEQLANIPDQNLDSLSLGGRELREKAKSYLAKSVDASDITRIYKEMATLKADNEALKEMLSQPSETTKSKKG